MTSSGSEHPKPDPGQPDQELQDATAGSEAVRKSSADDDQLANDEPDPKRADTSASPALGGPLYRNVVSLLGLVVIGIAAMLIAFALLAQFTIEQTNPYFGIFTYILFPSIMGAGGFVFLLGMRFEAGRRKRTGNLQALPYPSVDLNIAWQRKMFVWGAVGVAVLTTLGMYALFQGFHYTESVQFCGQTCHTPMEPEYTAYVESPHARVPCVDCHVGEGTDWYVRSKLSGARQLLAVTIGSYSRPIETPIKHLRPARETCEHCHWPEKFYGAKLLQLPRYRYDESNTAEQITLTLKTGGGSRSHGQSMGIHWHMIIANQITFATADEKHLEIPWVQVKHENGTIETYTSRPVDAQELAGMEHHRMDCMDCHNRPTHNFPTPDSGIDQALFRREISSDLPWVKKVAVDVLTRPYPDREVAHREIRAAVERFYREKYPSILAERPDDVEAAVAVILRIHDRSVFPKMHVDWRTYPQHIGHKYWPGCFRCHDGRHRTADGRLLSASCDGTCHTQPKRGAPTAIGRVDPWATDDWHSWEMTPEHVQVKAHERLLCHECHQAGERPYETCGDCHKR